MKTKAKLVSNTEKFSNLKPGEKGKVVRYVCEDACALRLQEMGLCVGTEFEIMKVAPLGDPVEVEFRRCRLCLRKDEISQIEVEVEEK
jgi:ferrous iron transport protein A